jgi:hypothetical protein
MHSFTHSNRGIRLAKHSRVSKFCINLRFFFASKSVTLVHGGQQCFVLIEYSDHRVQQAQPSRLHISEDLVAIGAQLASKLKIGKEPFGRLSKLTIQVIAKDLHFLNHGDRAQLPSCQLHAMCNTVVAHHERRHTLSQTLCNASLVTLKYACAI